MKNEDMAPLARLIDKSFDVDIDKITAFDPNLVSPFEDGWQALMGMVEGLVLPEVVTRLMTDQGDIIKEAMVAQSPLLKVLGIRIEMAIAKGTIADSLRSFGLDKLNESIHHFNIKGYTVAFGNMMALINTVDCKAVLINSGFSQGMYDLLDSNNNTISTAKKEFDKLKITRKNLSPANKLVIKQLYEMTAMVCKSAVGVFSMPKDKDKIAQYTIRKVLKTVRPTLVQKPRNRYFGATKSMCIKTKPVGRDTIQMTLLSEVVEPIYYCMCDTKTGVCLSGGVLEYNVTTSIKQKDIKGSGRHLVISNSNLTNAVVRVFTVKG